MVNIYGKYVVMANIHYVVIKETVLPGLALGIATECKLKVEQKDSG